MTHWSDDPYESIVDYAREEAKSARRRPLPTNDPDRTSHPLSCRCQGCIVDEADPD